MRKAKFLKRQINILFYAFFLTDAHKTSPKYLSGTYYMKASVVELQRRLEHGLSL